MRQITKDIEITIDGSPVGFRLFKLDAFSGVQLHTFYGLTIAHSLGSRIKKGFQGNFAEY